MKVNHYECDECGTRLRRITVHVGCYFGDDRELHFCSTKCMDDLIGAIKDDGAVMYWLTGQDLRDGA